MEDLCDASFPANCPGRYCGRVEVNSSCFTSCQACPDGFRISNVSRLCQPCDEGAGLRDYLFLGFMCLMCIGVRLMIVGAANVHKSANFVKLLFVLMTLVENGIAILFTLLVLEPKGSFRFSACNLTDISDFYPIFFNPSTDYVHKIECSYEVAYPRYHMVFVFFAFSLLHYLLLLPVKVCLLFKFHGRLSKVTEFVWLIAFPIIVVIYSICAGILYYAFDYILIVTSLGGFAVVSTITQLTKYVGFKNPFRLYTSIEQWCFTVTCMLYLAYGILSLTNAGSVAFRAKLLPLILAPPILHPLLSQFTSPKHYLDSWGLSSGRYDE